MKPSTIRGPQICMQRDFDALTFVKKNIAAGEFSSVIGMGGCGKDVIFDALRQTTFPIQHSVKILNATTVPELHAFIQDVEKYKTPMICLINLRIGEDISWFVEKLEIIRQQRSTEFIPVILSYIGDIYAALARMNKLLSLSCFPLLPIHTNDAFILLSDFEKRYTYLLQDAEKEKLFSLSNGLVGLLKSLFLLHKENPGYEFTQENLLKEPSIQYRLQQTIANIPESKIKMVLKNTMDKNEQLFFERFGFIKNADIFSPLLKTFLKQTKQSTETSITKIFTSQELSAFNCLQTYIEDLVSRQQLADNLWSENAEEKYSDWAIDQLIHKLREKIKKADLPFEIITKKGEGFILASIQ